MRETPFLGACCRLRWRFRPSTVTERMRLRTRKCGETESAGRAVLLLSGQEDRSAVRAWSSASSHDRHRGRLGASIPDRRGSAAAGALGLSGRSVGVLGIPGTVSRRAEPARMWPDVGPYPRPSGSAREPSTTMVTFGVRLRTTRRSKTGLRCRAWVGRAHPLESGPIACRRRRLAQDRAARSCAFVLFEIPVSPRARASARNWTTLHVSSGTVRLSTVVGSFTGRSEAVTSIGTGACTGSVAADAPSSF